MKSGLIGQRIIQLVGKSSLAWQGDKHTRIANSLKSDICTYFGQELLDSDVTEGEKVKYWACLSVRKSHNQGREEMRQFTVKAMDITNEELAEFMHDHYEGIAKMQGWGTQKDCQVKFSELPEANRKTMLYVAEAVIKLIKSKLGAK